MDNTPAKVSFADIIVEYLEAEKTLPAKFKRMLKGFDLPDRIKNKNVAIKMHLGGNLGYTTIHPLFVRLLVDSIKTFGAKSVKVIDVNAGEGVEQGYTREVVGCMIVPCFGKTGKYVYPEKIGYKKVDSINISGEALDSDFLIDLAHLKGHGDCGFGGAMKNLAMGLLTPDSRGKLHSLEGGIEFDKSKCEFCLKCIKPCPNNAISYDKKEKIISIFYHNCTYCQHCVLSCPTGALIMENRRFEDFAYGMALVTSTILKKFNPENLFFINFLTNITIYCDCWGLSTASLVPDIGILAANDIAAIETVSLDMIKTDNLLPNGLPKGRQLLPEGKHLFERIHAKNPYLMVEYLTKLYDCTSKYELVEVK